MSSKNRVNVMPGDDHTVGAMGAKQGMASGSQKAATSHYGTRAMPSTRHAAGAFGREATPHHGQAEGHPEAQDHARVENENVDEQER